MKLSFAISIILAALAVVFSLQNAQPVKVTFLYWSFEGSLVIILLLTFLVGVIAAFIASIPGYIRMKRESSAHRKAKANHNG